MDVGLWTEKCKELKNYKSLKTQRKVLRMISSTNFIVAKAVLEELFNSMGSLSTSILTLSTCWLY